jgi:outer membrane immunogenic protein
MKRFLLITVSLGALGLASPVLGADLPYAKARGAAPAVHDWTGFYIGAFGGYGFGNHNLNNANGAAFGGAANFTVN